MTHAIDRTSDARVHADELRDQLEATSRNARRIIPEIDDPRARALFETTAEVLDGLVKAFRDFGAGLEAAWR